MQDANAESNAKMDVDRIVRMRDRAALQAKTNRVQVAREKYDQLKLTRPDIYEKTQQTCQKKHTTQGGKEARPLPHPSLDHQHQPTRTCSLLEKIGKLVEEAQQLVTITDFYSFATSQCPSWNEGMSNYGWKSLQQVIRSVMPDDWKRFFAQPSHPSSAATSATSRSAAATSTSASAAAVAAVATDASLGECNWEKDWEDLEKKFTYCMESKRQMSPSSPLVMFSPFIIHNNPENVRVLMVGIKPYPNPAQAMGYAFSSPTGTPTLDALQMLMIQEDANEFHAFSTERLGRLTLLENWSQQGVMCINCSWMTYSSANEDNNFNISDCQIWKKITRAVIKTAVFADTAEPLVVVLFGKDANDCVSQNEKTAWEQELDDEDCCRNNESGAPEVEVPRTTVVPETTTVPSTTCPKRPVYILCSHFPYERDGLGALSTCLFSCTNAFFHFHKRPPINFFSTPG